ncbi:hypothetical protein [Pseudophaeobacter flagellatus]|uniref:hypothetical protein n=1 Tax=Pseudophaeobacter flagellatus TaxID=2899119 RepID=UPI001E3EDE2A|nr:hypothetical protein [Pseudophaeobacter flagellatus]
MDETGADLVVLGRLAPLPGVRGRAFWAASGAPQVLQISADTPDRCAAATGKKADCTPQ